jgi:hypothetical protein
VKFLTTGGGEGVKDGICECGQGLGIPSCLTDDDFAALGETLSLKMQYVVKCVVETRRLITADAARLYDGG